MNKPPTDKGPLNAPLCEQDEQGQPIVQKLHSETALIAWHELQRFFAQGMVLQVADTLDLVQVGALFADDDVKQLEPLLEKALVGPPSNDQARAWYHDNVELWSVVVAPYVLVQTNPVKK